MENGKLEMNQMIDQELLVIDEFINNGYGDEAYQRYTSLVTKLENTKYNKTNKETKAKVYISFAYFLFAIAEFQSFFEMLIKAQEYGYSRDEIDNLLMEAFIKPNLNEFRNIYDANIRFLISNKYIHIINIPNYQELPFWLLPTGTLNEYYMYDKEQKLIQEKISLYKYQRITSVPTLEAFSDYLLFEDWNWYNILTYTNSIKKTDKKTYIVINTIDKFLSCLQGALLDNKIISNVTFFDNYAVLQDYFINTSAYLPRNFINLVDKGEKPKNIINKIHESRIHKDNRKGDRVILSICIPSYNRGNRAYHNILNLLQSYYDEEIEFIISNNGTQNETKAYYDKIKELKDSRIKYFAFDENAGFSINLCKSCELASGRFILLLSDEDLVNLTVLPSIMNIIYSSKTELAIMKTSSTSQYKFPDLQSGRGRDALLEFMLTSNYMSGLIYNNKLLKQYGGIQYIKDNLNNSVCFYYPHMYWELLLCQYGDVQTTSTTLIIEGKPEKTDIGIDEKEKNSPTTIPYYAKIESRIDQHKDFTSIIRDLEISLQDSNLLRQMYLKLCFKTLYLASLSIKVYYKKENTSHDQIYQLFDRVYKFCSNEKLYKININSDDANYKFDVDLISQYYQHLKNLI